MLQRYYGMEHIYPNDEILESEFSREYPNEKWLIENRHNLPNYKFLFLHWPLYFKNNLQRRHKTAFFVREPVQRTLSVLVDASVRFNRSIEDLLKDNNFLSDYLIDIQTRFLGAENLYEFRHNRESINLNKTISKIKNVHFIGVTELFHESCLIFDKTFGTKIVDIQMKENVLRKDQNELMKYANQILPMIEKDQILYENITAIFKKRLNKVLS